MAQPLPGRSPGLFREYRPAAIRHRTDRSLTAPHALTRPKRPVIFEEVKPLDVIRNDTQGLDGLAQLEALIATGQQAPIAGTLGFSLVEIEKGRAVFEGTPGRDVYNPIGTIHGGYAATLLDSACGCAVHSMLMASQGNTTLDLKVSYHRPLSDKSGRVRAEGLVLSFGRRAAFAEAKLTDAAGRLCASATSTLLVFDAVPSGRQAQVTLGIRRHIMAGDLAYRQCPGSLPCLPGRLSSSPASFASPGHGAPSP